MTNKGRPSGSRRIDPEMRDRAIALRRSGRVLREIAEATGISMAHLKTIFKQEGVSAPHRGRPPGVKQKKPRADKGKRKPRSMAQRAVVRDPERPRPKPRGQYSPVVALKIEERMRKRREREEAARGIPEGVES